MLCGVVTGRTRACMHNRARFQMDAANVRRDFRRALALVPGLDPLEWMPRELRHSFVSVLSDAGVPVEQILRLVGHSDTTVTELCIAASCGLYSLIFKENWTSKDVLGHAADVWGSRGREFKSRQPHSSFEIILLQDHLHI